ncbi:hypothetical protein ASD32_27050 [Rhizobium sp. Root483D2]|nr:hypothetical protein ASD32_27050 [Rhizobium sp. Root483D2]
MPCDPDERLKAAAHCLKAWQFGIEHGHMDNPFLPAPAPNSRGNDAPLTISLPVHQIAHDLLKAHTGQEGGCPKIDWYRLRSEISDAIAVALDSQRRTDTPPAPNVPCPCTLIEQDEDCPVGYPSMICGVCQGKGHTTPGQVTALACEMIKIASDMGEPEDPFAAWESVSLIQSQKDQLRKALADMVPPKLTWKERDADGFLVHHQVAAINAARAALAASEGSADA